MALVIGVLALLFLASGAVAVILLVADLGDDGEKLRVPVLLFAGFFSAVFALALTAVLLRQAGISDPQRALALPQGSVRAFLAMGLLIFFAVMAVFFVQLLDGKGADQSDVKLAERVVTISGTLVTAIIAFYFGRGGSGGNEGNGASGGGD